EPGDIRDLSDVFEQLRRQILQTSRKTRNIECQCNAFEKERRRLVDAAVVVSEARIEPEVGRDGDTRGERGRPYPSIADIGGARKTGAVDEVRLDVSPSRVCDVGGQVEGAAARPAMPAADLECGDPVIPVTGNEIAGDRQATWPEPFLIAQVKDGFGEEGRGERSRRQEDLFGA